MNSSSPEDPFGPTDHTCIHCGAPAPYTWYCRRHTIAKELAYALYDLENDTPGFHSTSLKRIEQALDYLWEKSDKLEQ